MAFQATGPNTQNAKEQRLKIQRFDIECNLCELFEFLPDFLEASFKQ